MKHPNTSRGDVTYWQLTHVQAAWYHARLSTMHARQSRRFADRATTEARKAEIGCWVTCALLAIIIVIKVAQGVLW